MDEPVVIPPFTIVEKRPDQSRRNGRLRGLMVLLAANLWLCTLLTASVKSLEIRIPTTVLVCLVTGFIITWVWNQIYYLWLLPRHLRKERKFTYVNAKLDKEIRGFYYDKGYVFLKGDYLILDLENTWAEFTGMPF